MDSKQADTQSNEGAVTEEAPKKGLLKTLGHHVSQRKEVLALSLLFLLFLTLGLSRLPLHKVQVASLAPTRRLNGSSLAGQIKQASEAYTLELRDADGQVTSYKLADLGISVDAQATVENARDGSNYFERLAWWETKHVPLVIDIDHRALHEFAVKYASKIIQPAKDADLKIVDGKVKLVPEVPGKAYGLVNPEQTVMTAVANLQKAPLELKNNVDQPDMTTRDLQEQKQQLETMLAQPVVFKLEGRTITAARSSVGHWIELTPVPDDKTIDITVNGGKVLEYINALAGPYIHPPQSQVVLTLTGDGKRVLVPGADGIDVVNKRTVAANISKQLLNGQPITANLDVKHATYTSVNAEAYDKWILVDLTNNRLYAYEKANLLKTFLMSDGRPETPTAVGEFHIYIKLRRQDMRGANADGSRYVVPNVQWINYFYESMAIHGNYWLSPSAFGHVDNSHGCIGVQNYQAEWIYNWAPLGTPVITYR